MPASDPVLNILHIGKYHPPVQGGIERFLEDLSREQARLGHTVRILAHRWPALSRSREYESHGVLVRETSILCRAVHTPLSPAFPLALRRAVHTTRPHVIHAHLPNVSALWAIPPARAIPLLVHWHADAASARGDRKLSLLMPLYRVFEKRLLRRARAIIATSPQALEASRSLAPHKNKCSVIPLGLDPDRLAHPAPAPDSGPPLVLAVGRFAYYKGFEHLIRAAAMVPQARFTIAGNGPGLSRARNLVRSLGLENRVSLPGPVDDPTLARLLAECALFCLPSVERTEAFGLALLEAMAHKKPLLTTNIPGSGVACVNIHNQTGLCVPPADSEALARAMTNLLENTETRQTLGLAARERFKEKFHIRSTALAIDSLYQELQQCPAS